MIVSVDPFLPSDAPGPEDQRRARVQNFLFEIHPISRAGSIFGWSLYDIIETQTN